MSRLDPGDPITVVYPDADPSTEALFRGARRERIEAVGTLRIHTGRPASDAQFLDRVGDAHALILGWDLPGAVLAAAPRLELISFAGTGAGKFVDLEAAARRGITVCNTPGYANRAVAEHALALMLAAARHVPRLDRELRAGRWNQSVPGIELAGKTLGVVGLGGIGVRLAELGRAIGMEVIGFSRDRSAARRERLGLELVALEDLLARSDVVSIHVAHTPETEGLIGAREIGLMRAGAILVNTARGEIVDEAALVDALRNGRLAAAGLDVFVDEPLPRGAALAALDNVVLSPHVGFNTPEATAHLFDIAVDNVLAWHRGQPVNVVAGPR